MISVFAYDRNKADRENIRKTCSEQVFRVPDEDMTFTEAWTSEGFVRKITDTKKLDLLYYEYIKGTGVEALRDVRKRYDDAMVMLMTDAQVSPLEYLKPGVAPDSLLMKPYTYEQLRMRNEEFVQTWFMRNRDVDDEEKFLIDTKGEKVLIPYSRIFYFEARNKKMYVRAGDVEYAFYDTIDALEKKLPPQFKRCHRSYIVNIGKIRKLSLTDNYLEMDGGVTVSVSRRYKTLFKDLI